jgi:hypothetical protein
MPKVFIEPRPKGRSDNDPITDYVVEDESDHVLRVFPTQVEAIKWAREQGYMPLLVRVRLLNNKKVSHHWRAV